MRIPEEFEFDSKEVYIRQEGNNIIISEIPDSWRDFFFSKDKPTPDFMKEREQLDLEERYIFK